MPDPYLIRRTAAGNLSQEAVSFDTTTHGKNVQARVNLLSVTGDATSVEVRLTDPSDVDNKPLLLAVDASELVLENLLLPQDRETQESFGLEVTTVGGTGTQRLTVQWDPQETEV